MSFCLSVCLFFSLFVCSSVANAYWSFRTLGPAAKRCWRPWATAALLGQLGQCPTYWWRRRGGGLSCGPFGPHWLVLKKVDSIGNYFHDCINLRSPHRDMQEKVVSRAYEIETFVIHAASWASKEKKIISCARDTSFFLACLIRGLRINYTIVNDVQNI